MRIAVYGLSWSTHVVLALLLVLEEPLISLFSVGMVAATIALTLRLSGFWPRVGAVVGGSLVILILNFVNVFGYGWVYSGVANPPLWYRAVPWLYVNGFVTTTAGLLIVWRASQLWTDSAATALGVLAAHGALIIVVAAVSLSLS